MTAPLVGMVDDMMGIPYGSARYDECFPPLRMSIPGYHGPVPYDNNSRRCGYCDKPATNQCGKCKKIRYCGIECQRAHWKQHKSGCQDHSPKS
jgi:hypothetical protein